MFCFQINIGKLHILKTQIKKEWIGFVLAVYSLVISLRNRIYQIRCCKVIFDCWVARDMERFDSFLVITFVRISLKDLQSLAMMLMSAIDAKGL